MNELVRDIRGGEAYENTVCPICEGVSRTYCTKQGVDGKDYDIDTCTSCGFVYVRTVPSKETLRQFYAELYGTSQAFDPDKRFHKKLKNWFFAKRIKSITRPGRRRVLEIGYAFGNLLKALQREGGFEVEGIDFGEAPLQHLKSLGLNVSLSSVEDKKYPDGHFDTVVGLHVLEHVQDPERFIREVRRILAPGGRIYIQVPTVGHWRARRAGTSWRALTPPCHLWFFAPKSIRLFLTKHGFRVLSAHCISNRTHLTVVAEKV